MSWQKFFSTNSPATFRGAPFKVEAVDFSFGWKIDDTTAPMAQAGGTNNAEIERVRSLLREESKSSTVETSRLPKQFRVRAYFSGLNYVDEKLAFMFELEQGGTGRLILPTYDPINVRVGRVVNRFSGREGGFETIDIEFLEAGEEQQQPTFVTNTERSALLGIDDSKETFIESFTTKLESGAQWVADASSDLTELVSTTINDTLGLGAVGDGLEAVTEASNTLAQNATTLIYTPTVLANQISDTISALTLAFEQPANAFNAQLQLLENYGIIDSSTGATPTEQDAIDNNNAFVQIVNNAAVAEAGRAAVLTEYESLDDAQLAKSRFEAAARAQQLVNGNTEGYDEGYREIANIIALVSDHITAQGELPSSIDVTYPDSNAALVLAEDLYGDADRAAEIVTRNDARHPLFLPNELTLLSF
jgi:prophage DNA circulation protein